jgi:cyanophycinase
MLGISLRPLLAGTSLAFLLVAPAAAQQHGPAHGALVIVGGAMKDTAIVNRFIALAGGAGEARIVVVPTAGGADSYDQDWGGAAPFRQAGAEVTILHTTDREEADTPEFAAALADATGVWFAGGRQWRLADSYLGTRTHEAFHDVLRRGGVIGGSSAGASIQADFMVRGDTRSNTVMIGDHVEGLGFIRGVGIDQHLLARNRQFDMLEVLETHPTLFGIGLDEDTGIVVTGDRFEVIGQSYVAVYDPVELRSTPGRFTLLGPGTVYDLAERRVVPREGRR